VTSLPEFEGRVECRSQRGGFAIEGRDGRLAVHFERFRELLAARPLLEALKAVPAVASVGERLGAPVDVTVRGRPLATLRWRDGRPRVKPRPLAFLLGR